MKVVSVINQKGGCGKTITAINLAAALSGTGRKTLLIDLDPQSHATLALGMHNEEQSMSSYAIFEAFINHQDLGLSSIIQQKYNNLFVIPSHISLSTMEQKMSEEKGALKVLSNVVSQQNLAGFEYVIIDTPPNLGFLTLNAIIASDRLIVPIDVSNFSLNGVNHLNKVLHISEGMGYKNPVASFVITLFDGRSNFAKDFLQKTRQLFGEQLLQTVIRSNIKLRESVLLGKAIFEHAPHANGALDYTSLTYEVFPELKDSPIDLKGVLASLEKPQAIFRLNAPYAKTVYVTGTFNNWTVDEAYAMKKLENGTWIKIISLPEGTYYYKFVVDGKWQTDPANNLTENDFMGGRNSVLAVKAA